MLLRYNPWADVTAMQRQLESLFEDFQTPVFRTPAVEIKEDENVIYLKLELPGIEAKDIDIEVTENTVKVVAERQGETNSDTRSEFYYGKFQRVIPLQTKVQNTAVKAEYKDGILNLTLPKTVEEKNKIVKVNL